MVCGITGKTLVYGIIGCPVGHSLSPAMHNAGFSKAGLNALYVPWNVFPSNLEAAVLGLKALGVAGFNVTVPHKTSVMELLDEISSEAETAGAVNTVVNVGGKFVGHNTDGAGLVIALRSSLNFTPARKNILLLGAGGAARGAVAALAAEGVTSISVHNRTREKAERLCYDMSLLFPETLFKIVESNELICSIEHTDLLLNSTTIGMDNGNNISIPVAGLQKTAKVYDMVYTTGGTQLCRSAASFGIEAADGLSMLAAQGELAFKLWTGTPPENGLFMSVLRGIIRISKP